MWPRMECKAHVSFVSVTNVERACHAEAWYCAVHRHRTYKMMHTYVHVNAGIQQYVLCIRHAYVMHTYSLIECVLV